MGDLANILGKRVRHLRQQRGLSQEDYAEFANITMKTLWCIETAKHSSRFDTIEKIAKVENIPYYYLFMTDDESHKYHNEQFSNEINKYFKKLDDVDKKIVLDLLASMARKKS